LAQEKPTLVVSGERLEIWRRRQYGEANVMMHGRVVYDDRARTAQEFIDRWGMVAAIPDGEDSAGRQKLRLATPDELVVRAMQTVDLLYSAMDAAGWRLDIPSYSEFIGKDDDAGNH